MRTVKPTLPLQDVGRQDITAQVDFTSVESAGRHAGLDRHRQHAPRLAAPTLGPANHPAQRPAARSSDVSGWQILPAGPEGLPPDALPDNVAEDDSDDGRAWLTGLTHLARPGGLGDFRALLQAKGVAEGSAALALSWLDGAPAEHGYTPSSLASLIPPQALHLTPA